MKKAKIFNLSLFVAIIFFFNIIEVQAISQIPADNSKELSQIKEIRQSIKHYQKANEKLENKIEIKSKQIEKVLIKLPENSVLSQENVEEQLSLRLEGIMTQLMQIGEYETASWEYLKAGNKQINAKKYNNGIKNLKQAENALKNKNEMLSIFKEDLDAFLVFLNSLQYK
jgi:tetratricopeptide (TPR) repeat protein